MANYFNTLSLRDQLTQLGKCRFMEANEFSDGVSALKGKKIVIVGCGAQGLNQGLNMRVALGFEESTNFSKFFKKHTGIPPKLFSERLIKSSI